MLLGSSPVPPPSPWDSLSPVTRHWQVMYLGVCSRPLATIGRLSCFGPSLLRAFSVPDGPFHVKHLFSIWRPSIRFKLDRLSWSFDGKSFVTYQITNLGLTSASADMLYYVSSASLCGFQLHIARRPRRPNRCVCIMAMNSPAYSVNCSAANRRRGRKPRVTV